MVKLRFRLAGIKSVFKKVLDYYPKWVCKREYERQSFIVFNERPVEYTFVFRHLSRLYPVKVLDVGTGTSALPQLMSQCGCLVTAIDNVRDYWPSGMFNRHFHILDDDITSSQLRDKFDLITCISVLEHIKDSDMAVRNMFSLLKPNGHIILTFPYTENCYVRNVYELPGSQYGEGSFHICQSFSRREISKWLGDNDGTIVEQEYWRFWDGEFWTVGNQLVPPYKVGKEETHQVSSVLIQKRHG
jgi:SAM-dependent methyltransferase